MGLKISREILAKFKRNFKSLTINSENIVTLCDTINSNFSSQKSEELKKRAGIQREYDLIDGRIKYIIDAISSGFSQPEFKEKMEDLKGRKLDLEINLKEIVDVRESKVTVKELMGLSTDFKEYVLTQNIPEIKRIIKYFIKEIIVDREQVKIVLNLLSFLMGETIEQLEEEKMIVERVELYTHLSKKYIRRKELKEVDRIVFYSNSSGIR